MGFPGLSEDIDYLADVNKDEIERVFLVKRDGAVEHSGCIVEDEAFRSHLCGYTDQQEVSTAFVLLKLKLKPIR